MAQTVATPPPVNKALSSRISSYIFDIRFLGVLMQIAFIALIILGAAQLGNQFCPECGQAWQSAVHLP